MTSLRITPDNRSGAAALLRRGLEWTARYWYVVLPLMFLAAALPALGARPYRFEEGRRVAQVIAFFDGGSWLRLEIFGESYVNKPPLLPWLIALTARVTGQLNEFSARLPSVIALLATVVTAGLMAARASTRRPHLAALAAGAFVMAAPITISRIRLAETDATATAFAAATFLIWALARLRRGGEVDFVSWCGIAFCCAAALLAKGPPPLLFPLLPMILIPLAEKRWRQLLALVLALAASSLPLAGWLVVNLDVASVQHLSSEMRLRPSGLSGIAGYLGKLPMLVVAGLLQFFPGILAALVWIAGKSAWNLKSGWLNHALFLFAVPVSVLMLFWPTSEARYLMPAVWPLSVMAGMMVASSWDRVGMPALLAATLALFVVVEGVYIAREGHTPKQVEERHMANSLVAAVKPLPAEPILIWAGEKPNYNLYVYMLRNVVLVSGETLACKPDSFYLLAEDSRVEQVNPLVWSKLATLDGTGTTLYQRRTGASGC